MNDDTLVVVHAYAGDQHQVASALPQYLHHECPVLVLSPADSPVQIPGVECASAGKRAYTGQDSIDRQRAHLELLLDRPERWFLLHDSDSVCLSPELGDQLYRPDTVFYNAAPTVRFLDDVGHPSLVEEFPEVFQPPLFVSRAALERMLDVSDEASSSLPPFAKLIDWYFVAMARAAGLRTEPFDDGICRPIWSPYEVARVYAMVRLEGYRMLHSIKTRDVLDVMTTAFAEYNADPLALRLCRPW